MPAKDKGDVAQKAAFKHPCHACPLERDPRFRDMEKDEVEFMSTFKTGELQVQPGANFILEGGTSPHLYTVLDGWGYRFKTLEDGRRQILNFVMPGDFLGLQGSLLHEMQHSVEALSKMTLCVFERERLFDLYERKASLAYDITWLAAREEQILDEHLLSVGRRSALERSAYLIAFVHARAIRTGLQKEDAPLNPFTQTHVADTLGLSLVHTNKTLRVLQQKKLIAWSGKSCRVLDAKGLRELSGWEGLAEVKRPFI